MIKKKILPTMMAMTVAMSSGMIPVNAEESGPYIANPSFEQNIDTNENQLYKAERSKDRASDGEYSIKIGAVKPDDESKVPLWRYTQGKGSVNVVIHNVKPNTEYEVSIDWFNETGVKMATGVLDVDGNHGSSPWKLSSTISRDHSGVSKDWATDTHKITTGPRTNEIYAFAYPKWTGDENGSGLFYVDNIRIKEVSSKAAPTTANVGYKALPSYEFPATVPAIQSFEKAYGSFNLDAEKQVFSTDSTSKAKTEYLAKKMKEKGIIKDYEIKEITKVEDGKGIVVVKQPIQYDLPASVTASKIDAYQIDITEDKVMVYADYVQGIQNGTMTLLQAFTQRKVLPTGTVKDYSDQVVRGLQVDSGRRYYSIEWLKNEIEQMAYYKQNKMQLRLKDNEGIRYDSKVAAAMRDDKGGYWNQEEVNELVNYAAQFNIEVIPEIDFPGHAEQDAAFYKDWGLAGSTKALDFSREDVREYMLNVYQEAVDFFHADTIHIGGDEFFQSGYTTEGKKILDAWAKEQTGNDKANDYDALKLFFNEAAETLMKNNPGLKVIVWNDNMKELGGVVPLNKDIIVDFWAGGFYGSITAQATANAGYQIMSSSSSNYHDLWPEQNNMKLDRPLPKDLYAQFTRYHYSKGSTYFYQDEVLTQSLDMSLGQMFPIWDDAHGYVPEYILSRTLFPRYGGFAYKTWGADYINAMTYEEFENLLFQIGSSSDSLFPQTYINYTKADLDLIVSKIEEALTAQESSLREDKVNALRSVLNDIKENAGKYEVKGFYNDIVDKLIDQYENINYTTEDIKDTADKTKLLKVLKEVQEMDLNVYQQEGVDSLKTAMEAAEIIMADKKASQDTVDKMVSTLEEAVKDLKLKPADYSAVDKAIKDSEKYLSKPNNYSGLENLQAAIDAVIRDFDYTQQAKVDEMAKAINNAIAALEWIGGADTEKLDNWIKEWYDYFAPNEYLFKEKEFAIAKDLITRAEAMVKDPSATQEDVNALAKELYYLYDELEYAYKDVDLSELDEFIGIAEALNAKDYADFSALKDALNEAKQTKKDAERWDWDILYQEDVDEASKALEKAILDLTPVFEVGDKRTLNELYNTAKETDTTPYTEESVKVFHDALKAARALYYNPIATQEEVNEVVANLRDAIDQLKRDIADYTKVDEALAKVEKLNKNHYVDFSKVEEAVKAVEKDLNPSQQERVDAMAQAIEDAIAGLQLKDADYTKVDEALAKADKLNKADYIDFSGVEEAMKAVVRDMKITEQAKVDAMAQAIEDAIAKLEKKPTTPDYVINDGKAISFKQGEAPVFRLNAELDKLKEVRVDGKVLDKTNYVVKEGMSITLTPEFTKTLSKGEHTMTIVLTDGEVSAKFTVVDTNVQPSDPEKNETNVPTGDDTQILLWGGALAISGLVLAKFRKGKNCKIS